MDTKLEKRGKDFKVKLNNRLETVNKHKEIGKKADLIFKKNSVFLEKRYLALLFFEFKKRNTVCHFFDKNNPS